MFRMGEHGVDRGHHAHSEYEAIKHELKAMYARGEIDGPTYHRLKHLAKDGDLGWDDLRRLRTEGRSGLATVEAPASPPPSERSKVPQADTETRSLTEWIRQHAEKLREAEEQSNALLGEVEEKTEELRARLDDVQRDVDAGSTNERLLQSQAERKLAIQQQISVLESRAGELGEDLQRIDSLRSQLAMREEEARVAESRRRTAALEEAIKGEQPNRG